jgi:hypothetical protein
MINLWWDRGEMVAEVLKFVVDRQGSQYAVQELELGRRETPQIYLTGLIMPSHIRRIISSSTEDQLHYARPTSLRTLCLPSHRADTSIHYFHPSNQTEPTASAESRPGI